MEDVLLIADKTEYVDIRMVDIHGVVATLKIKGAGSTVVADDVDGDQFIIVRENSTIVLRKGIVYFKAGFNSVLLFGNVSSSVDNDLLTNKWMVSYENGNKCRLCSHDEIKWIENRISWFCSEIRTNVTGV